MIGHNDNELWNQLLAIIRNYAQIFKASNADFPELNLNDASDYFFKHQNIINFCILLTIVEKMCIAW